MSLQTLRHAWGVRRRNLLRRYYPLHGALIKRTRRSSYVAERIDGCDPCRASGSAAVFCHYDRYGSVHDYVVYYLKCLGAAGFRIYFVSNAPYLKKEAVARLAPLCAKIIRRVNVGHDFGAYKEGILEIPDRQKLRRLLIANDSVYGPLHPIDSVLDAMPPDAADVWGLTDSFEVKYHVQSYFVLFHRAALQHDAFDAFWEQLPFVSLRGWVIHQAEVGLTQKLVAKGVMVRSLCPYEHVTRKFWEILRDTRALTRDDVRPEHRVHLQNLLNAVEAGIPLNPTHFFWEILIGHLRYPFIKRDLLEHNPAAIAGVSHWRELVQSHSSYDVDLIASHQKLRLKDRSL
jgi:lipopolysaccharide biosynthesis protein